MRAFHASTPVFRGICSRGSQRAETRVSLENLATVIEAVENDLPIPAEEKAKGRRLNAKRGKGREETRAVEAAKAVAVVAGQTQSKSLKPVEPAGLGD